MQTIGPLAVSVGVSQIYVADDFRRFMIATLTGTALHGGYLLVRHVYSSIIQTAYCCFIYVLSPTAVLGLTV